MKRNKKDAYIYIVFFIFILFIVKIYFLQKKLGKQFKKLSIKNKVRLRIITPVRGNIYDANNNPIIYNKTYYEIILEKTAAVIKELGKYNKEQKFKNKKIKNKEYLIIENASLKDLIFFKEHFLDFKSLKIIKKKNRLLKEAKYFSHIAGYANEITEEEIKYLRTQGYRSHDIIGKVGIEKYFDNILRGKSGIVLEEVDANNNVLREIEPLYSIRSKKGADIVLTIDKDIQKIITDSFDTEYAGFVIVSDPYTGDIKAMQSFPLFNANDFIFKNKKNIYKYLSDKKKPLINRAVVSSFPPGSTFKIVSLITGVRQRKEDFQAYCPGQFKLGNLIFKCWKKEGHKKQNLRQAIANSCNVYFYKFALLLNIKNIVETAKRLRYGFKTGIELPFENSGILASPEYKKKVLKQAWYKGDTLNTAIGQGYMLVTGLQQAAAMNTIAAKGVYHKLNIVKKIIYPGKKEILREIKSYNTDIDTAVFQKVTKYLEGVIDFGTGYRAGADLKIKIAGKTGTVQRDDYNEEDHGWFICFFPADKPKYSLIVFGENAGSGGHFPAQTANKIIKKMIQNNLL